MASVFLRGQLLVLPTLLDGAATGVGMVSSAPIQLVGEVKDEAAAITVI